MPFNLAVFGVNRGDSVIEKFPEIQKWYIGGHSLGGAMASSYANKHIDKVLGLILLGAYSVNTASLPTIVIYGSEDGVLNRSKLEDVKDKVEIAGGNHAYFGNYGEQDGDGTAIITREEQQNQSILKILDFINSQQKKK